MPAPPSAGADVVTLSFLAWVAAYSVVARLALKALSEGA
jgi:hypothetical protein